MKPEDSKPCLDCGTPTWSPRGKSEWYMVHDHVWQASGAPTRPRVTPGTRGYYLCIGCLETRLGRKLEPGDFTEAPINQPSRYSTARLNERLTA